MGVRLLNFFDLKPLNTSKWSLNPPFFRDTQYILYIEATNRRLAQWGFTDSILLLICSNHTQNTHTLCSRWELQFCNFLPTLIKIDQKAVVVLSLDFSTFSTWQHKMAQCRAPCDTRHSTVHLTKQKEALWFLVCSVFLHLDAYYQTYYTLHTT